MKDKCLIITSGVCLSFWLVIAIFSIAFLDGLIVDFVKSNAAMLPQTETLWGQVPGDTETEVIRNFTFYNFTNPYAYLFRGQMPKFVEQTGFAIQELSSMLDLEYNNDKSQVSYNYWLHFSNLTKSRDLNEKVHILNAAPLGFWAQLNSVNLSTFTIQGLGPLFIQLNRTIKTQAIGQGVAQQFLPDYKTLSIICKKYSFNDAQCKQLWQDPINGLNQGTNYEVWIEASYFKDESSIAYLLGYFPFSRVSMTQLITEMTKWAATLNEIINNWYCGGKECSGSYLTAKQMSTAGVTSNPPQGLDPSDTFCSENVTCEGYPEISSFVKHVMQQPFKNYTFSLETFQYLLTPGQGLLNIGNLNKLWEWGYSFEQQNHPIYQPTPSYYLFKIQQFFRLQSQEHAYVFWRWIKYFANEFVLKKSQGGSGKIAGLGGIVAASIYQSFTNFGDWIVPELRSYLTFLQVGENCQKYFSTHLPQLDASKALILCQRVDPIKYQTYVNLLSPCINGKSQNLTFLEMAYYCDQDIQRSFQGILNRIDNQIKSQYGCKQRCTGYELSLKQFVNSTVTLSPIRDKYRQSALTAKKWNSDLDHFEYQYFIQQILRLKGVTITLDEAKLRDLMSFDKLWSAPMMGKIFLIDDQQFRQIFYWEEPQILKNYVRFMMLEVGFGGFTQERSVAQLIYGYKDPFITKLVELDPLMGGDPSVPTLVAFNEPNLKKEEAYTNPTTMNTGYIDPDQVRIYTKVFGKNYITYNRTWFDGDNIGWSLQNPWKHKVKFNGTDSIQNKPAFTTDDKVSVYLTTITRGGQLVYNTTLQMYGVDLYEMVIDKYMLASQEEYEYNNIFYQTFNGFLNLSYQGLPLFVSKNHFYSAPSNWSQLLQFYDEMGNRQYPNHYDDTKLLIQPYSGASFIASIYLQSNYYQTPDVLFNRTRRMLPIFSLYRSGNISESAVQQYFGPLKTALMLKRMLFITSIVFMLLVVVIYVGCQVHKKNKDKQIAVKESLFQSVPSQ